MTLNQSIALLASNLSSLGKKPCTTAASPCKEGLLLPIWTPTEHVSTFETVIRSIVYGLGLAYLFLGVNIIADRFMAAIEVITSQEKKIHVKDENGEKRVVMVRVWNETVSNLTLMALGSSAPEILLGIIEVCGNQFKAGELGPNTIVGSAAYNLFVIIGYCILVVPAGEVRRIKHLRVFFVTATWSIFAYIWLYMILAVISEGVVELWEALLTFIFFPLTVLTAYLVDRKIFFMNFLGKKVTGTKLMPASEQDGNSLALSPVDPETGMKRDLSTAFNEELATNPELRSFEENRKEYLNILKELRQKNPDISIEDLQRNAELEILKRGPKSRAYYRIQATRKLIGGTSNVKKRMDERGSRLKLNISKESLSKITEEIEPHVTQVCFDPGHYTCFESIGVIDVFVARTGGDLNRTVLVDYKTDSGSAQADSDFESVEGTMTFYPGETRKHFSVRIIDDDVYEEDEHFYAKLSNVRYGDAEPAESDALIDMGSTLKLAHPSIATIMILDDDHGGVFIFAEDSQEVVENAGVASVKVLRTSGARGRVKIPYRTVSDTAVAGRDFEAKEDYLVFDNNEAEKFIEIGIVDDQDYVKNERFYIEIGEPICEDSTHDLQYLEDNEKEVADLGRPRLGERDRIEIVIKESKVIKGLVDKLMHTSNAASILVGTSSWREQFREALTVSADDDDDEEGGDEGEEKEPKQPSCSDYVLHYISLFWKVLFAFVPPTDIWNGWACFVVSISLIGVLTAIIGDVASHFGCTVGLKDSVTAISLVALGTSLPDTFASKVAAVNDKYADSSVGNVTGSNAVNVFLGIGLAWSFAAIYHTWNGTVFYVDPGNLAFSVTLFCSFAVAAIAVMMLRRLPAVGGELGGPAKFRYASSTFFIGIWVLYLLLSGLESYCHIKGF